MTNNVPQTTGRNRKRERYLANREALIAYQKDRYQKKRNELLAYQRDYRAKNASRERARSQAWKVANRDRANERERARYARATGKFRSKHKAWSSKNREWYRAKDARRRAQSMATKIGKIDFKKLLREFDGLCGICRSPLDVSVDLYHFDHIIPLAAGGSHTTGNIQIAHAACNLKKGAKVA
jgi:5-methylcytosine-specific restriction endonuclease McrA